MKFRNKIYPAFLFPFSIVQQDLSRVDNWSDNWQINFNYKKCNHMHLGRDQPFSSYYMIVNGEPNQMKKFEEQRF